MRSARFLRQRGDVSLPRGQCLLSPRPPPARRCVVGSYLVLLRGLGCPARAGMRLVHPLIISIFARLPCTCGDVSLCQDFPFFHSQSALHSGDVSGSLLAGMVSKQSAPHTRGSFDSLTPGCRSVQSTLPLRGSVGRRASDASVQGVPRPGRREVVTRQSLPR